MVIEYGLPVPFTFTHTKVATTCTLLLVVVGDYGSANFNDNGST